MPGFFKAFVGHEFLKGDAQVIFHEVRTATVAEVEGLGQVRQGGTVVGVTVDPVVNLFEQRVLVPFIEGLQLLKQALSEKSKPRLLCLGEGRVMNEEEGF